MGFPIAESQQSVKPHLSQVSVPVLVDADVDPDAFLPNIPNNACIPRDLEEEKIVIELLGVLRKLRTCCGSKVCHIHVGSETTINQKVSTSDCENKPPACGVPEKCMDSNIVEDGNVKKGVQCSVKNVEEELKEKLFSEGGKESKIEVDRCSHETQTDGVELLSKAENQAVAEKNEAKTEQSKHDILRFPQVPEKSLDDKEGKENLVVSLPGEEEANPKHLNKTEKENKFEIRSGLVEKDLETEASSQVEKGEEDEKLPPENQIEQTLHQTDPLSGVKENKQAENVLRKNQIERTHFNETGPPAEVEEDDEAEKPTKENQIEHAQLKESDLPAQIGGDDKPKESKGEKNETQKMLKEDDDSETNICTKSADDKGMQANITVPEALKDTISTDHRQQEKPNNEEKVMKGKSSPNQVKEMVKKSKEKLPKKVSTKHPSDYPSFKVLSATNDTSSNGGKGTCPVDQPRKESGQVVVTLPLLQNGSTMNNGDEDDDDDDDDGKKPRQMLLKRGHEFEELQKEKKKKKMKKQKDKQKDKQESQKTTGGGDFDKSKINPSVAGDVERGSQPVVRQDDDLFSAVEEHALPWKEMEWSPSAPLPIGEASVGGAFGTTDKLQTEMEQLSLRETDKPGRVENFGPAGDNRPMRQYMFDGINSCPQEGKRMPFNLNNSKAARRHFKDNGCHTGISLPPGQPPQPRQKELPRGPPAATFHAPTSLNPQDAIRNVLEGDLFSGSGGGLSNGAAAGLEPESPMEITAAQRVHYGNQRDIEALVSRIAEHDCTGLQEDQDGVLFCKEMLVKNGKYQNGGQYNKLMFLGQGTFGDVYLIQDKVTKMNIVAKRVLLEKFSGNEALNWAGLEHPNISRLLGLMRSEDMVYFFSEYHPGQTLQALIKKEMVLGQGRALFIVRQIFEGLAWLHRKRIVHKDVKPQNILVDDDDHVRLIDFGESKFLVGESMQTDLPEGTECYMAPEIARSEMYNGKVDVWSAYCLFICAISGDPPWCRRFKAIPIKIFIIGSEPAPLQDVPSNTDPEVERFIAFGLVGDLRQRPTSAQVLENFPDHLVDELYNVRAVEEEPNPAPEGPFGIPGAVCNQLVTPCTPRGPQTDVFRLFDSTDDGDSLDITQLYGIDSPRRNLPKGVSSPSPSIHGEKPRQPEGEEDLYGPGADTDLNMYGPDFIMDVRAPGPDEIDGATAKNDIRDGTSLAANRAGPGPLLGSKELDVLSKSLSPVNSQAAHSFIEDQAGDQHEDSLEIPQSFRGGSDVNSREQSFSRTVYDSAKTSNNSIVDVPIPSRASSSFSVRENRTSGFRSVTPGVSSDFCPSSYNSMKTSVEVFTEGLEPIKIKISSGITVSEVAGTTYSKKVPKPFTLVWRKNGLNVHSEKFLLNGEFQFNAVAAPDSCENWLWRVDNGGHISRRDK